MKVYLDVCCLNRPFDDLAQDRIRLESEAVLTILNRGEIENWIFLSSEVVDVEIARITNPEKRQRVGLLATAAQVHIIVDEEIGKRATSLQGMGLKAFDALHVACAEKGNADIFLTTDDDLLRKASQNREALDVRVENPLKWLVEEIEK